MMGFVVFLHITICILLIIIILIQAGRGGGLVESFSSVESMFGPKTNVFLTRATTVLSTAFFITCLTLAFMSARQSRSLMPKTPQAAKPIQTQTVPVQKAPEPVKSEQSVPSATQAEKSKPENTNPSAAKTQ